MFMGDTKLLGKDDQNELVRILEGHFLRNPDGSSSVKPASIENIGSNDDYVLIGYKGMRVYMFHGSGPKHVEAMLSLAKHMISEGFRAYRGISQTRAYLFVDKST